MEVLNDLVGYNNLKIYQNTDWFSFSLDSVLLPNFVTINSNVKLIVDFCTGNAPIPLILSTKTLPSIKIIGVEIQEDICDLAKKTIFYNKLEDRVSIYNKDINDLSNEDIIFGTVDIILCNPPYFKFSDASNINGDIHKTIARHEIKINLEQIIKKAFLLLKNGGIIAFVHRTERLIEIIKLLESSNFSVKKIRFVYPKKGKESNLVLIEARKNGNNGLKVLDPLIVHDNLGNYTAEVLKMFE